jgi:SAM-dependent MidA family methyltransferase
MALTDIIIDRIKTNGPLPFRDFMEMSLYHPELGYYTSQGDKIGKTGDYYTSVSLTPVFGAMIAKQIEEMWLITGERAFTIVEYGAGTGALCHDILDYFKNNTDLYEHLHYCIIEKSPSMRQKERLHLHEKVSWHGSITELKEITGCVLSNELLDNFAVHRVMMTDQLMEVFVDYSNGFRESLIPASDELKNYLAELNVALPPGYCTEINLEALQWMKEIASAMKRGYVITIDYGFPSAQLYNDKHCRGTLMCYNRHHVHEDPYNNIGSQDITAHVNFSALKHWGTQHQLETCGFINQAQFLLNLGFIEYMNARSWRNKNLDDFKKDAMVKHTLLFDMGDKFKVLIQRKNMPDLPLSGLRIEADTQL